MPGQEAREQVMTVWPCDHGGVEFERFAVPEHVTCGECGTKPILVVPRDRVTRLEEALRWYADEDLYRGHDPEVLMDVGHLARAALSDSGGNDD